MDIFKNDAAGHLRDAKQTADKANSTTNDIYQCNKSSYKLKNQF